MPNRNINLDIDAVYNFFISPFSPNEYTINGKNHAIMRIKIPTKFKMRFNWFHEQKIFPKIFWENPKDNITIATLGQVLTYNSPPKISNKDGLRFFGGQDFMQRRYKTWKNFPSCSYILPLIEFEEHNNFSYFILNRTSETVPFKLELEKNFTGYSKAT